MKRKKEIQKWKDNWQRAQADILTYEKINFPDFSNWKRRERREFLLNVFYSHLNASDVKRMSHEEQVTMCVAGYVELLTYFKESVDLDRMLPISAKLMAERCKPKVPS